MSPGSSTSLESLADRLGCKISDLELLRRAVTHASARSSKKISKDNERLEFLGDRVLGLCVAEMLMHAHPDAAEGELAPRLNRLVRKEMCAQIADEDWDLGAAMIMSGGEALSGGRRKMTILGNACEAVLGAIFVDGGFDVARDVINRFWGPRLLGAETIPVDAKTALQEWAQARRLALPSYRETKRAGPDHEPHFVISVSLTDREPAIGEGPSKRVAEQAAAEAMLLREGIWKPAEDNG